jgi:hypothetical protein
MGDARFVAPRTVAVGHEGGGMKVLRGKRVFLNVGTRATLPDVPGMSDAAPMTHVEALELGCRRGACRYRDTKLALESSSLLSCRVFPIALPTLALRRFAEDGQRPAELDRGTPHAERHKESSDHRRQTAETESVESDICAGPEH